MKPNHGKHLRWTEILGIYRNHRFGDVPSWGYAWADGIEGDGQFSFIRYRFDAAGTIEVLDTQIWQEDGPDSVDVASTGSFVRARVPTAKDREVANRHARTLLGGLEPPRVQEPLLSV